MRRAVNSNNPPEICRRCGFAEGITGGDENFVAKYLASGGAPLPPPPPIGYVWSAEEARAVELDCRPQSRKSAK
ncbi:MAG: hypothetical protein BWZ10_01879 [candidate division BRC1 bacterium ADurb.BinA364]|nr:MAG: hypothetical protein BWZ10_01879 [candidate division BRC1 bacterium ADurb.BinA364]